MQIAVEHGAVRAAGSEVLEAVAAVAAARVHLDRARAAAEAMRADDPLCRAAWRFVDTVAWLADEVRASGERLAELLESAEATYAATDAAVARAAAPGR